MPEQTPTENPSQPEQPHEQAGEIHVGPEHFLAPILGRLSVYQAGVMLMRYHPDGTVAMPNSAIAQHYGVSQNAISQVVRRVWRDFPDSEPERTPRNEYVQSPQKSREPVQRNRPERYRLGDIEVSLSKDELAVMSRRYDYQGRVIAGQKDVAEELGISLRTLSRIEHRVLDEFPELADTVKTVKAAAVARTAQLRNERRRKPEAEKVVRTPKPAQTKKPKPPAPTVEEPPLSVYEIDAYMSGIDLKGIYDVSKPPDDEK